MRCTCARRLALCEDCFAGNGDESFLLPLRFAVNCECGAVTDVWVLEKFKTA